MRRHLAIPFLFAVSLNLSQGQWVHAQTYGGGAPSPAASPTSTPTPSLNQWTVKVYDQSPEPYLADWQDKSLYWYDGDQAGGGSNCYDACETVWPPYVIEDDKSPQAWSGVDSSKLGTITRRDGKKQVTYGGKPLYYYQRDRNPGDKEGQATTSFGNKWYLVKPDGTAWQDSSSGSGTGSGGSGNSQ